LGLVLPDLPLQYSYRKCASLVSQFNVHDDLTLATYYDVILHQYVLSDGKPHAYAVFQSHNMLLAKLRALVGGITCKIPFTQKIAAQLLAGVKTGWFSKMNPGHWSKKYEC
jgi:hypothetical protein